MKIVCKGLLLKSIFKAVKSYSGDLIISVMPEGMASAMWHTAGIGMTEFYLDKNLFEVYEVKEEQQIGLNIELLSKTLSRILDTENIELSLDMTRNELKISNTGEHKKQYKVRLLETTYITGAVDDKMKTDWKEANKEKREDIIKKITSRYVPEIDYLFIVQTKTAHLIEAMKDIELLYPSKPHISYQMEIAFAKTSVSFIGEQDTNYGTSSFPVDSVKQEDKPFTNKYNFNNVSAMVHNLVEDVTLQSGKDMPLNIYYPLGDKSHIQFLLAPMLEPVIEGETTNA